MKNFLSQKITVKKAGKKGRGVFAIKKIRAGETIELSPYIEIPKKDYKKVSDSLLTYYWYEVREKIRAIGLGYSSLYNHSQKNNADFDVFIKTKQIKITATEDIEAGMEIFINYGYEVVKNNVAQYNRD